MNLIRVEAPSTVMEMQKAQALRLWDVLFLGPMMIYFARKRNLTQGQAVLLAISGFLTITYNARNYMANRNK